MKTTRNIITITTGDYFTWNFKLVGGILLLLGTLQLVSGSVMLGLSLSLVGLSTFATFYVLQIDKDKHAYREGVAILGLKTGAWVSFSSIDYFFVKSANVSRTYNSRIQSATFTDLEYRGYIKFNGEEKVQLVSSQKKQKVIGKLLPIATALQLEIVDYTNEVTDVA